MPGSAPFRLNRSGVLLALISAAFAGEAGAAAARVDFTTPGVTVAGRDGQARPLARGAELDTGDTVRTSAEGRAQLRFSDGSYVSLQPNTDFAISDYKFEGKDDDRGFFGLVRGAMRTVTGAVGRVNRNSYKITTPTATVGIRGTGGVIQVLNDGATLVIGTSGIWSLTNPAGSIDIPAGVSGLAPKEPNQPPKETNVHPDTAPAPVEVKKADFIQGDQVNPDGTAAILPKVLVSGPGFQAAIAYLQYTASTPTVFSQNGDATFNGAGQLTKISGSPWTNTLVSGSNVDFGTDGILAWGRWVGTVENCFNGSCLPDTYGPNGGLHYVVGMPTAVMPGMGTATANYSLMGATKPTDGSMTGTFTGTLTMDFNGNRVSGNFNVAMSNGDGYRWGISTNPTGALFSQNTIPVTPSGNACQFSSCLAKVTGFFSGATAERAGISYHIGDPAQRDIFGAAAFKKN